MFNNQSKQSAKGTLQKTTTPFINPFSINLSQNNLSKQSNKSVKHQEERISLGINDKPNFDEDFDICLTQLERIELPDKIQKQHQQMFQPVSINPCEFKNNTSYHSQGADHRDKQINPQIYMANPGPKRDRGSPDKHSDNLLGVISLSKYLQDSEFFDKAQEKQIKRSSKEFKEMTMISQTQTEESSQSQSEIQQSQESEAAQRLEEIEARVYNSAKQMHEKIIKSQTFTDEAEEKLKQLQEQFANGMYELRNEIYDNIQKENQRVMANMLWRYHFVESLVYQRDPIDFTQNFDQNYFQNQNQLCQEDQDSEMSHNVDDDNY